MTGVQVPSGFCWERLQKSHPRAKFHSGEADVDTWLRARAWQSQKRHLSTTNVLLDDDQNIAGYYTLATGQVNFSDLPQDISRRMPRRLLPVATLAWLGVAADHQGRGLGKILLAQALRDCYFAGQTFAFVAVLIDCINDRAKSFYQRWDFRELPGHPYRLFLSYTRLSKMMEPQVEP